MPSSKISCVGRISIASRSTSVLLVLLLNPIRFVEVFATHPPARAQIIQQQPTIAIFRGAMFGHIRGLREVVDRFGRDDKALAMRRHYLRHQRKGIVEKRFTDSEAVGRSEDYRFDHRANEGSV